MLYVHNMAVYVINHAILKCISLLEIIPKWSKMPSTKSKIQNFPGGSMPPDPPAFSS